MPLFLLRHGETLLNVKNRYQGQSDSDLTETGIGQARANGGLLADLIADTSQVHFVSSPLGRTLATSEIICKTLGIHFDTIQTDPRLMEIKFGAWQEMTEFEIEGEYSGQWEQHLTGPTRFTVPGGGESYDDLFARVDDWLDDTGKFWAGDTIWIAVSHGLLGSVIRGRYLGFDVQNIRALERPHDKIYELGNGRVISHGPEGGK